MRYLEQTRLALRELAPTGHFAEMKKIAGRLDVCSSVLIEHYCGRLGILEIGALPRWVA
jgi:hypothetical protein